jgi:hypothetical protein
MTRDHSQEFSDEETARRRDELAKRMLNMPPQPLKPKSAANPKKRGRPKKKSAPEQC